MERRESTVASSTHTRKRTGNFVEDVRAREEALAERFSTVLGLFHSIVRDQYVWALMLVFPLLAFLSAGTAAALVAESKVLERAESAAINALSMTLSLGALLVGIRIASSAKAITSNYLGVQRELVRGYLTSLLVSVATVTASVILVVVIILLAPPIDSTLVFQGIQLYLSFAAIAGIYSLIGMCIGFTADSTAWKLVNVLAVWFISVFFLVNFSNITSLSTTLSGLVLIAAPGVVTGHSVFGAQQEMYWVAQLAIAVIGVFIVFQIVQRIIIRKMCRENTKAGFWRPMPKPGF